MCFLTSNHVRISSWCSSKPVSSRTGQLDSAAGNRCLYPGTSSRGLLQLPVWWSKREVSWCRLSPLSTCALCVAKPLFVLWVLYTMSAWIQFSPPNGIGFTNACCSTAMLFFQMFPACILRHCALSYFCLDPHYQDLSRTRI